MYYGYGYYFDWYYIPILLAVLFSVWTSIQVRSTFRRYSQVYNRRGVTGADAARAVLAANGFSYVSRAQIRREDFPSRVYEGVTLEAGIYDALIVELGSGEGANWWCVVYPPLCFAGETGADVQYRSRIWEIIQGFFADR